MSDLAYRSNMTVKEIQAALDYAQKTDQQVITLHFFEGSIMGSIKVGPTSSWFDAAQCEDITDWDAV